MNTLRSWIGGLISAACGGVSGIAGPALTDPDHFNTGPGLKKLLISAAFASVAGVLLYLKQSPLPGVTPQSKP